MRNLLVYALLGIALWYLARAALRHYLAPLSSKDQKSDGRPNRSADTRADNYQNAREARYRDVE